MISLAGPLAAQNAPAPKTGHVTYLSGASVYVSAGREDGLREGAIVEVVRGATTVATLKAVYLSSHQASCEVVTATAAPVVGDSVRFTPAAATPAVATRDSTTGSSPSTMPRWNRGNGLRGRLGARYLLVRGRDSSATSFSQPALDLRLDGVGLWGSPFGLSVDLRARRTVSILVDGTQVIDGHTRVYQANLSLNTPGAPFRLSVGRQFSPTLSTVSLFDGAMMDFDHPRWSIGALGGSQPDPLSLGYSGQIREYGGYLQLHNVAGTVRLWSLTLGGIGSYTQGKVNREFGYLQGTYTDRHLSAYLAQEVDYYHGWRLTAGEQPISPTSTFTNVLYRFNETFSIHGGFDNRRNVRLYRDYVSPETAFDDSYRQGGWAGASLNFSRRFRLGVDARSSRGGTAGTAQAYTLSWGLDRLTPLHIDFRGRHTRYTNPTLQGWLHSGTLSLEPSPALRFELNGGIRQETNPLADPMSSSVYWYGADLDLSLRRSVYFMFSVTRERGALQNDDQVYGGLSYRF